MIGTDIPHTYRTGAEKGKSKSQKADPDTEKKWDECVNLLFKKC